MKYYVPRNDPYIGLTENEFKDRFGGHNTSFYYEKYRHNTAIFDYVWSLKDEGIVPNLQWSIMKQVKSYSNTSKSYPLCTQEKFEILQYRNKNELLNKRSEILNKCRHMNKFLLANLKQKTNYQNSHHTFALCF